MSFEWPALLWLLPVLPALAAAYVLALRRRRRRHAAVAVLLAGAGTDRGSPLRRWLPPSLLLLGLAAMLVAVARPSAVVLVPAPHDTVILAIDVSGSMRANDVAPDRIGAARAAAQAFIEQQPARTRIGIVTFAAAASLVQPPTSDRQALLAALDRFQLQQATAIGSGLLVSLKAIFPELKIDLNDTRAGPGRGDAARERRARRPDDGTLPAPSPGPGVGAGAGADAGADPPKPVAPGSHDAAAIVLLSDGESSTGPDPIEAAKLAASRGVRVHTVGFGTPGGVTLSVEGWSMRVRLDEATLKRIADLTRGDYYQAASAAELARVYSMLNAKLAFERRPIEVSGPLAAVGVLLALLSGGLSLLWFGRVF